MLSFVMSLATRGLPVLVRAGGVIENKLNILGISITGGVAWLVNNHNQALAERRHEEQIAQAERHHQENMRQQEIHYQRVEGMFVDGQRVLESQIGGVRGDIRALDGRVLDMSVQFSDANRLLEKIRSGVDQNSQKIAMCVRPPEPVCH